MAVGGQVMADQRTTPGGCTTWQHCVCENSYRLLQNILWPLGMAKKVHKVQENTDFYRKRFRRGESEKARLDNDWQQQQRRQQSTTFGPQQQLVKRPWYWAYSSICLNTLWFWLRDVHKLWEEFEGGGGSEKIWRQATVVFVFQMK